MEIEKPVTLGDKFAAARERRERLEKEREAARQGKLFKLCKTGEVEQELNFLVKIDLGVRGCFMWNDDGKSSKIHKEQTNQLIKPQFSNPSNNKKHH